MASTPASSEFIPVTIPVPYNHPVLQAKRALDWDAIETCLGDHWRAAGKNVDRGPGRPFDLSFWSRVVVLMMLLKLDLRQMERELKYNVVARRFVTVDNPTEGLVRDHANIDRTYRALGVEGVEALNTQLIQTASRLELTDGEVLSSDTTIQEARIPYPNEPGLLRQVAQRVGRLCRRVLKKGGERFQEVVEQVSEKVKEVFHSVKEYRLFAQGKQEKSELMEQMLQQSDEMMRQVVGLQSELVQTENNSVLKRVGQKLSQLQGFTNVLFGQIRDWLDTGVVAREKLLHPGIVEARSHSKKKPGKRTEFGFKWLVNRLKGGYLFGQMYLGRPSDSNMPKEAVSSYQRTLGTEATPELFVFDRGGWSERNVEELQEMGVGKVGIQPKGQADWCVGESDQDMVATLRGRTEASIGTLKTGGYEFNKSRAYSTQTTEMAGQRAFVSRNLNQLMMDLQNKEKQGSQR